MLYLSLFLSAKFAITIPYLPMFPSKSSTVAATSSKPPSDVEMLPLREPTGASIASSKRTDPPSGSETIPHEEFVYSQAAAPPAWGIIVLIIPLAVAAYISATRYSEFWHFGFDVLGGTFIGVLAAWSSFRWYHPPLQRGDGWAWGPRSAGRAFGVGVGNRGYVDAVV